MSGALVLDPLSHRRSGRKEVAMSFRSTRARILAFIHRVEDGQGLAEYALILALIAIVAIVALIYMGSQVSSKLSVIGSQLKSVSG